MALKKLFGQVNWPNQTSRLAKQSWTLDLKGTSGPGEGKGMDRRSESGMWKACLEKPKVCALEEEANGRGEAGQKMVPPLTGHWMFQQGVTDVLKLQGGKGAVFCSIRGGRQQSLFQTPLAVVLSYRTLRCELPPLPSASVHKLRRLRMPPLPFYAQADLKGIASSVPDHSIKQVSQ